MKSFTPDWGDTLKFTLDLARDLDGLLVTDFAGWELWFTIKSSQDDADPGIVQKKKSAGTITTSGGTATCKISATECRSLFLPNQAYYFDWQGMAPNADVGTLEKGTITFSKDTTKATS